MRSHRLAGEGSSDPGVRQTLEIGDIVQVQCFDFKHFGIDYRVAGIERLSGLPTQVMLERYQQFTDTQLDDIVLKSMDDYIAYQAAFQKRVIPMVFPGKELPEELTSRERNDMVIKMVLSAIGELIEFLEKATNYKVHKGDHEIDMDASTEEYVDVMKYLWNIQVYMPEIQMRFKGMFIRKSIIVDERLTQEQQRIRESQSGGENT